jgi:hypothetical protein
MATQSGAGSLALRQLARRTRERLRIACDSMTHLMNRHTLVPPTKSSLENKRAPRKHLDQSSALPSTRAGQQIACQKSSQLSCFLGANTKRCGNKKHTHTHTKKNKKNETELSAWKNKARAPPREHPLPRGTSSGSILVFCCSFAQSTIRARS